MARFVTSVALVVAARLIMCSDAVAELTAVEVGGELRVRGNWYSVPRDAGQTMFSRDGNERAFVESRARMAVTAHFSRDVAVHFELDDYTVCGEDFRSDHLTGLDGRAGTTDDVEVYQAYIDLSNAWRAPLRLRIGRQELRLGSEWLVGNNDTGSFLQGLSFDGVRLTLTPGPWTVEAGWFHLEENSPVEEDGDVDLYLARTVYGGIDRLELEAYWLYLRDGRGSRLGFPFDTPNGPNPDVPTVIAGRVSDAIEDFFGVDQYETTTAIHTVGLRAAGTFGRWDFEAEAAYQRIDPANITKRFFNPDPATTLTGNSLLPFAGPYGEDNARLESFAFNVETGYTFDAPWSLRPFFGAAYFEGHDNRADNFGQFIRNFIPFFEQNTSGAFNRLFSDWEYSDFLDDSELSNVLIYRGGLTAQHVEVIDASIEAVWFETDERTHTNGVFIFPFIALPHSDELGWELRTKLRYHYSDDLHFEAGYSHWFAAEGLEDGNFVRGNGLRRAGGMDGSDAHYFYIETMLQF